MISAPAFNHKKGNAAHSRVSEVDETTVKEMHNWKATPRDNALLKISNVAPIQDGCPTDVSTTEMKISQCALTILCYFLAAFPSLKVS